MRALQPAPTLGPGPGEGPLRAAPPPTPGPWRIPDKGTGAAPIADESDLWRAQARDGVGAPGRVGNIVPHDKLKDAARALAATEGLSYVDARWRLARRAVIDHHFQSRIDVDAHHSLLCVSDVADRVVAEGRVDRLLLGLTWAERSVWADLPAWGGHLGVVESGFAGSRALCRHLALQARAHGAEVHVLAPGAPSAYPGMDAVGDPEECQRHLVDLFEAAPTAERPVFAVIDNPYALGTDIPSRGISRTRIHRLLTRAPEHLHVVLRCEQH